MADNTTQPSGFPEEPVDPNARPDAPGQAPGAQNPPPPRKKRRRWPLVLGGVVLFLLFVLVFAPSLLSIGPARSMVLAVVNNSLDGRVEVADWSLGWNSGITLNGLKVYEDKAGKNLILQASRARTELSLLKALRSNFTEIALGRTDVDNLDLVNLHIDEQGVPNIAKVAKPSQTDPNKKSGPTHLSGDIHVNHLTGVITSAAVPQKLRIHPSDIAVTITSLNDPVSNDVRLAFTAEDPANPAPASSTPGTITLKGKADLFDGDTLNVAAAVIEERLELTNVNLAALNPLLAINKLQLTLAGIASGGLDVNLKGGSAAGATGEIKVSNFQATGPALQGDTFTSNVSIPIKVTRTVEPGNVALLKVDDLRVVTDYGAIAVTGSASQESLERLANRLPPGREGRLTVTADFEQGAKLLESLRHTLRLEQDLKIDSAKVFAQVDAWLFADRVVNKVQFKLADVAATNKSARVTLEPVNATVDATYAPAGPSAPFAIDQLRDVGLSLASGFARLNGATGKGGTLAQFKLTGDGDFGKLRQQLAQFSPAVEKMQIGGTWNLAAGTDGDPSREDASVKTNVKFTARNLVVAGIGDYAPLRQPWLDLAADGSVNLKASKPASITDATVVLKSNNPENPTVDLLARGDVDLATYASKRFDVSVKALLAKARDEFGPLAKALNYLESGQLAASASGSYDGKNLTLLSDKPLAVKVSNLSVRRSDEAGAPVALRDQSLDLVLAGVISTAGEQIGADVKTLSIAAPKLLDVRKTDGELRVMMHGGQDAKRITGNGGIHVVSADLKRLSDLAKSFSPPATQPAGPDAHVGQLTRALLSGTLAFRRADQPVTTIDGNFSADVGVTTAREPINDKIAITLNASAPDELTQPLKAGLTVKSNTLNAAVSDAVVVLARQLADKSTAFNGPFDLLRSAKITVTADRLEMVQAMMDSFSPPAAPKPAPAAARPAAAPVPPPSRLSGDERISGDQPIGRRPAAQPAADVAPAEAAAPQPLPPLRILSGRLALAANVARENQTTALRDTTIDLSNFSFRRGDGYYEAGKRTINLKLAAAVETTEPSNPDPKNPPPLTASIRRIQVQELAGDLGVGQLKLARPIAVTNLSADIPSMDGGVQLTGRLGDALQMLEAYQGAQPGTKYPYGGDYDLTQNLTTEGDSVRLAGSLKATKFKAFDPKRPGEATFAEDLLTVTNDVSADTKTSTATIRNLLVNMESTGALKVAVTDGQLVDWVKNRTITKELQATVRIDWPKLWRVVRPMLDPETQESLKDLQLAGVMERPFRVGGSYPAEGPDRRGNVIPLNAAQSLKFLTAYGGVAFDQVAVNGIDVRDLDLPVSLERGVLYVQDATKPKGQRYPQLASCNGGTIDIGGLQIDLTHTGPDGSLSPWVTIPDANKVILKNVALNPVLADSTVGNYVNPGFAGPQDARGRVTLTSVECRDVPLDWFTSAKKQTTPGGPDAPAPSRRIRTASQSDGRAEFLLAISEMELQAPLLPLLLRQNQIAGEVKEGRITIENGIVKSNIPIVDPQGRPLMAWNGAVNLQDRRILNFNTGIAKHLLADLPVLRNNERLLPAVLNVPISGPFDKPKVDLVGAVTSSIVPGIGPGQKPEDIINRLPDILGGNRQDRDRNRNRGDEPINRDPRDPEPRNTTPRDRDRRSSADDPEMTAPRNDARSQPADPFGGLLDVAGGLLNPNRSNPAARDPRPDDRDPGNTGARRPRDPGDDRIGGNERISGEPRSTDDARPPADGRNIGDEPISRRATTAPSTTAPAERNVSGRTRARRNQ